MGVVHHFMGFALMHRDNRDRKDKMRTVLLEVLFAVPFFYQLQFFSADYVWDVS